MGTKKFLLGDTFNSKFKDKHMGNMDDKLNKERTAYGAKHFGKIGISVDGTTIMDTSIL